MSNNTKITITIPESLSNYIEGLQYEVNARRDIIALLIRQGEDGSDSFKRYHKEYLEYYAKLETAKDTMANEYVKPSYPECDWRLDFGTGTILVEPKPSAGSQEA